MSRKYLLGSGYFSTDSAHDEFAKHWASQIIALFPEPQSVVIVSVGGEYPLIYETLCENYLNVEVVPFTGNLGHVGQLLSGEKKHKFCGWSATFCTLALLAYTAELDFIFLEQDCLAFGPWVDRAYLDMGDGDMVFGRKMATAPFMPCAQSLVLVRHQFIPEVVAAYLAMGTDNDHGNLPETKFLRLEEKFGDRIRRLSFGCDRERPIPYDDEVFYVQKLTPDELQTLSEKNLI